MLIAKHLQQLNPARSVWQINADTPVKPPNQRRIQCACTAVIAAGIVMQNEVSETVSQSIEQKVNAIIQEQLNLSVAIIKENADKMAQLVDTLMEKTHLNKQEIQEVLND